MPLSEDTWLERVTGALLVLNGNWISQLNNANQYTCQSFVFPATPSPHSNSAFLTILMNWQNWTRNFHQTRWKWKLKRSKKKVNLNNSFSLNLNNSKSIDEMSIYHFSHFPYDQLKNINFRPSNHWNCSFLWHTLKKASMAINKKKKKIHFSHAFPPLQNSPELPLLKDFCRSKTISSVRLTSSAFMDNKIICKFITFTQTESQQSPNIHFIIYLHP